MKIYKLFIFVLFTIISTNLVNAIYDLSNYPSPFIRDGRFYGVIVVGDKASPEEVIAASDIISSLQFSVPETSGYDPNSIFGTIAIRETKTYSMNGRDYEVTLIFADTVSAQFTVNGQTTQKLGIDNEDQFADGTIIVLKSTSGTSVSFLLKKSIQTPRIQVGAAKLASEVSNIQSSNSILVGNPCSNAVVAEIKGNPSDCIAGYESGVGLIEAYENPSGTISVIVSGYNGIDMRNAAAVLANYKDYKASLKGNRVQVIKVNNQLTATPLSPTNQNAISSDPFGTKDVEIKISKNQASSYLSDANTAINSAKQKIQKSEDAINNVAVQTLDTTDVKNQIATAKSKINSATSAYQEAMSLFNSATSKNEFDSAQYKASDSIRLAKEAETLAIQAYDEIAKLTTNIQSKISSIDSKDLDINSIINQGKKLTKSLKEKEQIKFNMLGEDHSMTIDKVTDSSITVTFSSSPLTFIIELLKTIVVDINEDNNGDLAVTLKSISNGIADLEFSQPAGNKQITNPIKKETTPTVNFSGNFKYLIIGIVILVTLTLGGYGLVTIYKKRPKKIKEEKTEEVLEEVIERPAISKSADAISVSGFSLKHGKNVILDNVSFEIKRGELVCLLGPSGTGKSTVIESLVGRKTPDKGTIKILGEDIKKNKKIMDYVGFVPQGAEIYMNQPTEQNLLTSATKWGIKDSKKKVERILSDIGLSQRTNIEAKKLSGGQQKLLSLGMELIRDPELLILDEPTTGLDPNTRNNIITIISQIVTHRHKTALFTTHFMDDAEESDNVIILADKKIVAQGSPSKLKKMLPGTGRIVNVILDNITDDLLNKIKKIEGTKDIIREGRSLKIITEEPNAIKLGQKIDEIGGVVNKTEIVNATMKEVFVYFTGVHPEE